MPPPRFLRLLCLSLSLIGILPAGQAQHQAGGLEWTVESDGTLRTQQWPVAGIFHLDVGMSAPGSKLQAEKNTPAVPVDLSPESDRSVNLLGISENKEFTHQIQRSIKFFDALGVVRVLDVIKIVKLSRPMIMMVRYQTHFQVQKPVSAMTPKAPPPNKNSVVTLLASQDTRDPVMALLMGGTDAGWERRLDVTSDHVEWSYSGLVQTGDTICILHSLALIKDARKQTVDTLIRDLIPNGMPWDSTVSEPAQQRLVNYPIATETTLKPESAKAAQTAKLDWLEKAAAEMRAERLPEKDQLRLEGGEWMPGEFRAEAIKLDERLLKLEEIAAMLDESGTRLVRVFLRDGSVLRGRLNWQSARFVSEGLGDIQLSADAPGQLLLRRSPQDGQLPARPLAWMTDGAAGQVVPIMAFPETPLPCRWLGGELKIEWSELASMHALPPPALEHELHFKDGTRLRGWLDFSGLKLPLSSCAAWAGNAAELLTLIGQKNQAPRPSGTAGASLEDGSMIVGKADAGSLLWRMKDGAVELKMSDVARVTRLPEVQADMPALFEVTTTSGTRLPGRPQEASLAWKRGAETLPLPWSLITEIQVQPEKATQQP